VSRSHRIPRRKGRSSRAAVLRALSSLSAEHGDDLIASFKTCSDWQRASHVLAHALSLNARSGHAILSAPPGWLPPLS
jgi:hypothetical protein